MLLYETLAPWYHLIDPPEDHEPEATGYRALVERAVPEARSLLELGSGAGNNASFLKARYRCALIDLSEPMLALSRARNPECEHVRGDMRTVRLERTFDAVLAHDAIMYMTSRDDLLAAARTARAHLEPDGAALFAPDCVRETFEESAEEIGAEDLRGLMWTWDPDPADERYRVDFAFMLRERGEVRALHDRHEEGVFSRATWAELLAQAGFERIEHVMPGPTGRPGELFLARAPAR
jgi:SAM-dependent methyltransferase